MLSLRRLCGAALHLSSLQLRCSLVRFPSGAVLAADVPHSILYPHTHKAVSKPHAPVCSDALMFSPLILNLFFFFKQRCLFCKSFFFYLSKNAQLQKKLPFEIHLLIGTNKFYLARQRSARGAALWAVPRRQSPSAGPPPLPAAQHSRPGPLLPWLKGNLQCKGDDLKTYA